MNGNRWARHEQGSRQRTLGGTEEKRVAEREKSSRQAMRKEEER